MKDKIKWPAGNRIDLCIPLRKITVTEEGTQFGEYVPSQAAVVMVYFVGNYASYEYTPRIEDNKLFITDNGELKPGVYAIDVRIQEPERKLRSFRCGELEIVRETRQLALGDFVLNNNVTLDADAFIFGEGPSAYEVAVRDGYTGTKAEWLESLRGREGRGIADIVALPTGAFRILLTDGSAYVTPILKGEQGVSIVDFTVSSITSQEVICTITMSDGTTRTVNLPRGEKGEQGDAGEDGRGIQSVVMNNDYTLTFSYTDGTSYTTPQALRGEQGAAGQDGQDGRGISSMTLDDDNHLTVSYTDGTTYTTPQSLQGERGVSITDFEQVGENATMCFFNIFYSNGNISQIGLPKGEQGDRGEQGPQGIKGDTVVLGEVGEYKLYNVGGTATDGAMTQDATTKAIAAANGYYECGTAAGTAAKVAVGDNEALYTLQKGGSIKVKMTNANAAASGVTLKIGSSAATPLYYNNEPVSASNSWEAGEVISVYYDGTNYQATNAKVGSGKAADMKYDNSQSGLAAENVQEVIDESIVNSLNRGFSSENITLGASIGFFIAPDSKKWSSSSSSHYIIAIKPYDTFKITANANTYSDFAFLKRNDYPVNNASAPISDIDNVVHRIEAGGYRYATAPADANFLYIWGTHSGVVHDPQQIIKYVDDSERDDIVDGIYDAVYNFESVTGLTEGNGFAILATASYVNVTNSNYKHKYVARGQSWKRLKVKANNTINAAFFFVTSNPTPSNQLPLPLCAGTYTNIVDVGMTKEFYIPDDCAFIIFDTKAGTADYTPDIIEVNGESVGNLLSEETPIDLSEYDEILGWINASGDYYNTAGSGHYVIDVRGYDKFKGIAHATNGSYFVLASAVNGNSWTKYGGRVVAPANASYEFSTDGQPYLIVGNFSSQANRDDNNPVTPQSLSLVSNDRIGTLEERVSKLEDGGIGKTDIVSLNGKLELDTMFRAATRADRTVTSNGITIETSPLVFLHFSDLHGNESNLVRIVSLYNAYSDYVDDVINTGDNITNTFGDSFAFYGTHGAGGFLNVIGNHDAQKGSNSYATETELYAKFIGPFISQWGVTSYTENKCYYYKDYTDRNLRLIVLDAYNVNWNGNNAQITWLEGVLADAITNELHVMIAVHSGLCRKSDLDCNFNTMQARWNWLGSNDNVVTWQGQVDGYLGSVVDTFIQNGGKFICWLSGHTHCDVMGFGARHPNQMTINIGSSGNMELVNRASDIERVEGTKTQDCVNMVVIDTFKKQLKLYRIGGDIDRYFRSRKALVFDYDNREVIYQR